MSRGKAKSTALYEDLGVAPDATPADIRSAYRSRAKKAHPDAGGTAEAFERLAHAHRVLSSPDLRSRYDETGEAHDEPDNRRQQAVGILSALIDAAMNEMELEVLVRGDLVKEMRRAIGDMRTEFVKALSKLDKADRTARALMKRLSANSEDDPLGSLLERKLSDNAGKRSRVQRQIEVVDLAAAMIKGYTFQFEAEPPPMRATSATGPSDGWAWAIR